MINVPLKACCYKDFEEPRGRMEGKKEHLKQQSVVTFFHHSGLYSKLFPVVGHLPPSIFIFH